MFNLTGSVSNTLLVAIQGVVVIPIAMHALGPKLFGAWLCGNEILLWMQVLDVGVQALMIQRIGASHAAGDHDSLSEHFITGMLMMGLLALFGATLGLLTAEFLPIWLNLSPEDARSLTPAIQLAVIATAVSIAGSAAATLARGVQQTGLMNIATFVSTLAGFVTVLGFFWSGWGISALPIGIVTRSILALAMNCFFVYSAWRRGVVRFARLPRSLLKEYLRLMPLSIVGGIGHSLMYQSEGATVGIVLGAEFTPILLLTRKLVELVRSCVDMIGHSTFGSFSHLVASGQRERSIKIHGQILAIWLLLAVSGVAAYIAVNENVVSLWVGARFYGGRSLTVLLGIQLLMGGSAYLLNFLFRATGAVVESCTALFMESIARLPLMVTFVYLFGLAGVPLAAILTSLIAGAIVHRVTIRRLSAVSPSNCSHGGIVLVSYSAILVIATLVSQVVTADSWALLALTSLLMATGTFALVLLVDSRLTEIRGQLRFIGISTYSRSRSMLGTRVDVTTESVPNS